MADLLFPSPPQPTASASLFWSEGTESRSRESHVERTQTRCASLNRLDELAALRSHLERIALGVPPQVLTESIGHQPLEA